MPNSLKKHFVPVLFLVTAVFTFSFSMLFSPYSNETFGHDAGVFAYIGYAITQGKPMYTGAWDNKGPLLYFINALGIIINYRYGIYILEVISLFVTMLLMYKTALFFVPRYIALISTLLSVMPLTITLEGGNLSEEWALPFTAAAFYLIVKFFCGGYRLRRYEMMIVGACIAAIVLLRLNNIMFIAMSVLCIIIILLRKTSRASISGSIRRKRFDTSLKSSVPKMKVLNMVILEIQIKCYQFHYMIAFVSL